MLNNFFRINLPYGIARNENDERMAFNREYMPLGFNNIDFQEQVGKSYTDKPIYTKYRGLTDKQLLEVAFHPENGVFRDENGKIKTIFFIMIAQILQIQMPGEVHGIRILEDYKNWLN